MVVGPVGPVGGCECCCPCDVCESGCGTDVISLQAEVSGITQIAGEGEIGCDCLDLNTTVALSLHGVAVLPPDFEGDVVTACSFRGQIGDPVESFCNLTVTVTFIATADELYFYVQFDGAGGTAGYKTTLLEAAATKTDCDNIDVDVTSWDDTQDGVYCSAPTAIHITAV